MYVYCYTVAVTTSKAYGVIQAHSNRSRPHSKHEKEQQKLHGNSILEIVFVVPTAGGSYNDTRTQAHAHEPARRRSTVRGCHKRKRLEARLLYRGCLAF